MGQGAVRRAVLYIDRSFSSLLLMLLTNTFSQNIGDLFLLFQVNCKQQRQALTFLGTLRCMTVRDRLRQVMGRSTVSKTVSKTILKMTI